MSRAVLSIGVGIKTMLKLGTYCNCITTKICYTYLTIFSIIYTNYMTHHSFKCTKCGTTEHDLGEMRAAGGFWTKIFNIQNRKFTTMSCKNCGFTELYSTKKAGKAENVLDFITN